MARGIELDQEPGLFLVAVFVAAMQFTVGVRLQVTAMHAFHPDHAAIRQRVQLRRPEDACESCRKGCSFHHHSSMKPATASSVDERAATRRDGSPVPRLVV